VQLWDLSVGKSLAEMPHTHPVTSVLFNPVECILATACKDRLVRFWDLDSFDSFDACGPEATAAHSMAFAPDGQSLYVAYQDSLRKYGFEPSSTLEYREVAWGQVHDIMVTKTNVVSCSISGPTISVWAVETAPCQESPAQQSKQCDNDMGLPSAPRDDHVQSRPAEAGMPPAPPEASRALQGPKGAKWLPGPVHPFEWRCIVFISALSAHLYGVHFSGVFVERFRGAIGAQEPCLHMALGGQASQVSFTLW
jgi:hypothetical protein